MTNDSKALNCPQCSALLPHHKYGCGYLDPDVDYGTFRDQVAELRERLARQISGNMRVFPGLTGPEVARMLRGLAEYYEHKGGDNP